jgi:hypothetical protein
VGFGVTYPDVILELDSARRVQVNLLQCLSDHIVGLALALLGGLDRGGLLNVALVFNIELAEGIGEPKDVALLELRVFPSAGESEHAGRSAGPSASTGPTSGA